MSTNCLVATVLDENRIVASYVHYDGYPSYTGDVLNRMYNQAERAIELCHLGDIRIVEEKIEDIESLSDPDPCFVIQDEHALEEEADAAGCTYVYVFKNNGWHVIHLGIENGYYVLDYVLEHPSVID